MAESRQRVLLEACEYLTSYLKVSLESKSEQQNAIHSFLGGNDEQISLEWRPKLAAIFSDLGKSTSVTSNSSS